MSLSFVYLPINQVIEVYLTLKISYYVSLKGYLLLKIIIGNFFSQKWFEILKYLHIFKAHHPNKIVLTVLF